MKTDSLMIGDYVMTSRNEVIKVESISTKRQHRKVGYHHSCDICHIKYVRQGQIEPIPLTEEILKKNGWNKRPHSSIYEIEGVPFAIEIDKCELYLGECWDDYTIIFSLEYIHQLQHILRLCGLYEKADNIEFE